MTKLTAPLFGLLAFSSGCLAGGLDLTPPDIHGRLFIDGAVYSPDKAALKNGTELRRARVTLKGKALEPWKYKLAVAYDNNEIKVKSAYIGYCGFFGHKLKIGQFKEPFSMEELSSSKYSTFMERSVATTFAPAYSIGVQAASHGNFSNENYIYNYALGVFGEELDKPSSNQHESVALTGRFNTSTKFNDEQLATVGVSGSFRRYNYNSMLRLTPGIESHVTGLSLIDTGDLMLNSFTRLGVEGAFINGPCSWQGEYVWGRVNGRDSTPNATFSSGFLQWSYFLTGENRNFNQNRGTFGHITPQNDNGAWEGALRISHIDLDDKSIMGGKQTNYTAGINWYVNTNVRFMANVTKVHSKKSGLKDKPWTYGFRAQLNF